MVFVLLKLNSTKSYTETIVYSFIFWMHNTLAYKEFSSWETIFIYFFTSIKLKKLRYNNV